MWLVYQTRARFSSLSSDCLKQLESGLYLHPQQTACPKFAWEQHKDATTMFEKNNIERLPILHLTSDVPVHSEASFRYDTNLKEKLTRTGTLN
jgi:hypothetical protein